MQRPQALSKSAGDHVYLGPGRFPTLRGVLRRGTGVAAAPAGVGAEPRGAISAFDLLAEEVPVGRSCQQAGIPASRCICQHEHTGLGEYV